ncbi:hypothetical protein HPP92_023244 [Vanilla planifolia]|uniref:Amino acid transporter transmembrane domain-containing protein n=1 Tax=Vanilla planifolia TaxID=51239 RepID=A0A835PTK6_VANPL|nr:hypothetical protein HPP92_023244 [Vanilla planifolia]
MFASARERSICYQREGISDPCSKGDNFPMLMFGLVQIIFSQIPDFHNMQWLSIVAAIMSFSHSIIGIALVVAKAIGNGVIKGGITGVSAPSTSQKMWRISQAIGDIAFAYPYSVILLEVQNTLKSPPPENQTMKSFDGIHHHRHPVLPLLRMLRIRRLRRDTPGNLLTGFESHPNRLVDFANACIVLHLVGGYQPVNIRRCG